MCITIITILAIGAAVLLIEEYSADQKQAEYFNTYMEEEAERLEQEGKKSRK